MQAAGVLEVELTLRTLMLVLGGIFGSAWLVLWKFFKKDLPYGVYFAVGNLLVGSGVLLIYERLRAENVVTIQLADWMVVAGLSAFQYGVVRLFRTSQSRSLLIGVPLVAEIVSTAFVGPSAASYCWRSLVFNLVAGAICASTAVALATSMNAAINSDVKPFLVFPFLLGGVLFLFRGAQVQYTCHLPAVGMRHPGEGYSPYLWTFICLTIFLNISISGIVVSLLIGRLRNAAITDPLTGCLNRSAILAPDIWDNATHGEPSDGHACVMIDVDHFKSINDLYGHQCGDAALVHLTRVIHSNIRSSDRLGRMGGEEFLVVLPGADQALATQLAERIRAAIESQPLSWEDHVIRLTASFGVAGLASSVDMEDAIKRADQNLYWAKSQGRNRVMAFS